MTSEEMNAPNTKPDMPDQNLIPFNPSDIIEGNEDYPPITMLDRYKKDELIEMAYQWCDIAEEKIARIRAHLKSGTVKSAQALWYCRIFGKYAGLLPTGPAKMTEKE